jgi:hypothetical protein
LELDLHWFAHVHEIQLVDEVLRLVPRIAHLFFGSECTQPKLDRLDLLARTSALGLVRRRGCYSTTVTSISAMTKSATNAV